MQFYPRDFLSDINVQSMSLEQLGAYIKLMAICWIQDDIPNDNEELSDILGIDQEYFEKNIEKKIRKVFEVDTNDIRKLFNPRIKKDKKEAKKKYSKRSEVNKANIQKRWQRKKDDTNRIQIENESYSNGIRNDTITDTDTDTDFNNNKKTHKKEISEDQIVESNKMVKTTSSKSSELEKEFESTWRYCFDEYKKAQRPLGSKSEAKDRFLKQVKKQDLEIVKQSIYNYVQDCIKREFGFKHLSSFLSTSKKHVEEWKNGSENHKALLELKQTPQNTQKNGRGFENGFDRVQRESEQRKEQINRVFTKPADEMDQVRKRLAHLLPKEERLKLIK